MALSSVDLMSPLTMRGSLQDYSSTVNSNLSDIKHSIISSAVRDMIPGTPNSYPIPLTPLPAVPLNMQTDPWGVPYVYNQILPNVTIDSNDADTVYTISSRGPDGVLGNADDIFQQVNVISFKEAIIKAGG